MRTRCKPFDRLDSISTRHAASMVLLAVAACVHAPRIGAQGTSCDAGQRPVSQAIVTMITQLAASSDSAAMSQKIGYRFPADLAAGEVEIVSTDSLCARAAASYYHARDRSYTAPRPVLLLRLRSVYFAVDPEYWTPGNSTPRAFGVTMDSTLTSIVKTFLSR